MAVRINTDALTVGGDLYRAGQVIDHPDAELLGIAQDPANPHAEEVAEATAAPALPEGTKGEETGGEQKARTRAEVLADLSHSELKELAKEAGLDLPGNSSKAAFVEALAALPEGTKGEA